MSIAHNTNTDSNRGISNAEVAGPSVQKHACVSVCFFVFARREAIDRCRPSHDPENGTWRNKHSFCFGDGDNSSAGSTGGGGTTNRLLMS